MLDPSAKTRPCHPYEKFKTATMYDGTALHPEWLG